MNREHLEIIQQLQRNLAHNLRQYRHELRLSQEDFADRCGYHRTYIGAIERAERNVTLATLVSLARCLNIPVTKLLEAPDEKA